VLIDCGVLIGTADAKTRMRKTAQQIVDATGGRLNALVGTHEHWDHVGGFAQAGDLLGPEHLKVDEVWLGWTEKPGDPMAAELDKRRRVALSRVVSAANALAKSNDFGAKRNAQRLGGLLEFYGGLAAAGSGTTRSAMDWLRARTQPAEPKYLEPGMPPF